MSKIKKIIYGITCLVGAVTIGLLVTNALLGQGVSATEETSSENYTVQTLKKQYHELEKKMPITEEYIDGHFSGLPDDSRIIAESEGDGGFVNVDPQASAEHTKVHIGKNNEEVDINGPLSASVGEVKAALKAEFVK